MYFEIGEDGLIHLPQSYEFSATLPSLGYSLDGWNFNLDGLLNVYMEELHWWLTPSFRTSLDIGLTGLRRFDGAVRGDLAAAMVFDVDVVLLGTKEKYTVFSLPPPRPGVWIPLGAIGPVPVKAKIEFNVELSAEAEAQALLNFRTGMRQTAFAEFGIDYVRSRDPSVQWIRDADFSAQVVPLTVDINGELSLGLKLKPSISFLVYGLAGMQAAVAPSGKTVFSVGTSSDLTGQFVADVSLELTTAGKALKWIDPKPTLSYSIWNRHWHLFPPISGLEFIQHPQDTEVNAGDRLTLSALAQSTSPISYEWFRNGNFFAHGQNQISIVGANQSHAGNYHVVARSGGQAAVSDTARVAVESELLEQLFVSATCYCPILSSPLTNGVQYVFEVSGTWTYSGSSLADAEFIKYQGAWYEFAPPPFGGPFGETNDICDLIINGESISWLGTEDGVVWTPHTFSPSHVYRYYWTGTGYPVSFAIADWTPFGPAQYSDNSGGLTIRIFHK